MVIYSLTVQYESYKPQSYRITVIIIISQSGAGTSKRSGTTVLLWLIGVGFGFLSFDSVLK